MTTIFKTHQLYTRTPLRILAFLIIFSCTLTHTFTPSIAPVPGQPFATGESANGIAYSPNGKWLSNVSGSHGQSSILSFFSVNCHGSLTQIETSPVSINNIAQPVSITYSPDSRFASVCGNGSSAIDIFSIDQATGMLTGAEPLKTLGKHRKFDGGVMFGSYYYIENAGAGIISVGACSVS